MSDKGIKYDLPNLFKTVEQAEWNAETGLPTYRMKYSPTDMVNHPPHYTSHPSGIECIQVTEHMGFCVGNAIKYLWRADEKHDDGGIEDLKKALWYVQREISKRGAG